MTQRDSYTCPQCRAFSMVKGAVIHRSFCPLYVEPPAEVAETKKKIVADQNSDGKVSEVESREAELKVKCDEKGIKYKGTWGVKKLSKALEEHEEN